jgi:predicted CoA-binding protein
METDLDVLEGQGFRRGGGLHNREKYGNKVLRCYVQAGRKAVPVNPKERVVEGLEAVSRVEDLPPEVEALSIITPPEVTEKVVEAAIGKGIKHVWMQPGAESPAAIERAQKPAQRHRRRQLPVVVLHYVER